MFRLTAMSSRRALLTTAIASLSPFTGRRQRPSRARELLASAAVAARLRPRAVQAGDLTMAATTTAPPSDAIKRLLPWLVAVAFFMQSLDTTILNTAVPAIAQAMDVTPLEHEVGAGELHAEPRGLHPDQRLDGRPLRHAPRLRLGDRRCSPLGSLLCGLAVDIDMLVACRVLQGMGGAMMVPVGRMTMVRTFAKSELVRAMSFVAIPSLVGPMLGPVAGGLIVHYLALERRLLRQRAGRPARPLLRLALPARLSRGQEPSARHRRPGAVRRAASRCCPTCWRCSASIVWATRDRWACSRSPPCCWPATASVPCADAVSAAASRAVPDAHLPRGGRRQLLHAGSGWAASRSCSRCSTRSASASRRSSRACW